MKLLLLFVLLLSEGKANTAVSCPKTTATGVTKPLYLLTLVPFSGQKDGAGWDDGLVMLPGARIARDEINSRTDLLPDHHIELIVENIEACSHTEAFIGLRNFIKYTINPPCHPVTAIIGLLCSSHTSILSPVAGHDEFDLMQLSVANSPIFETRNNCFPHLWRFVGSSIMYADAVQAIMDQFNWQRIGVAYDSGSTYFSEIAKYTQLQLTLGNKTAAFSVGLRGARKQYYDSVVTNIKNEGVTVLLVLLNEQQTSILLNKAHEENLVYPDYIWIQIYEDQDRQHEYSPFQDSVGHIHLQMQQTREAVILVSGQSFTIFRQKYEKDFHQIKQLYSIYNLTISDVTFARHLYDQVWAFALAVNNSLTELESRNLSIDSYSIGQKEITAVIEQEMAKLSFQGAGGIIEFSSYHGVTSPVEVYWVSDTGTEIPVGKYNPHNISEFFVSLDSTDLPKDRLPMIRFFIVIPLPVAILSYILAGIVLIFTTIQLTLFLHYRKQKVVKASSPYLSLPMFAGCYFLSLASILTVTNGSFPIPALAFTIIINVMFVLIVNGLSMILVALSIKLLTVYRIFFFVFTKHGKLWKNVPLFLIAVLISIFPNIILALLIGLDTPKYHNYTVQTKNVSVIVVEEHTYFQTDGNFHFVSITGAYFALFLLLIIFLAIRTQKIKYENFKDTKKVNLFIAVMTVTLSLACPIFITLLIQGNEPAANVIMATSLLIISIASQLILFLLKVLPVLIKNKFPTIHPSFTTQLKSTVTMEI